MRYFHQLLKDFSAYFLRFDLKFEKADQSKKNIKIPTFHLFSIRFFLHTIETLKKKIKIKPFQILLSKKKITK